MCKLQHLAIFRSLTFETGNESACQSCFPLPFAPLSLPLGRSCLHGQTRRDVLSFEHVQIPALVRSPIRNKPPCSFLFRRLCSSCSSFFGFAIRKSDRQTCTCHNIPRIFLYGDWASSTHSSSYHSSFRLPFLFLLSRLFDVYLTNRKVLRSIQPEDLLPFLFPLLFRFVSTKRCSLLVSNQTVHGRSCRLRVAGLSTIRAKQATVRLTITSSLFHVRLDYTKSIPKAARPLLIRRRRFREANPIELPKPSREEQQQQHVHVFRHLFVSSDGRFDPVFATLDEPAKALHTLTDSRTCRLNTRFAASTRSRAVAHSLPSNANCSKFDNVIFDTLRPLFISISVANCLRLNCHLRLCLFFVCLVFIAFNNEWVTFGQMLFHHVSFTFSSLLFPSSLLFFFFFVLHDSFVLISFVQLLFVAFFSSRNRIASLLQIWFSFHITLLLLPLARLLLVHSRTLCTSLALALLFTLVLPVALCRTTTATIVVHEQTNHEPHKQCYPTLSTHFSLPASLKHILTISI